MRPLFKSWRAGRGRGGLSGTGLFAACILFTAGVSTGAAQTPDISWLVGDWEIRYSDSGLGTVTGYARISTNPARGAPVEPRSGDIVLIHPRTGETYTLRGVFFHVIDGEVQILLRGNSPASGVGLDSLVPSGAKPLNLPSSTILNLEMEGIAARVHVPGLPDEPALTLVFTPPARDRQDVVKGRWQYRAADAPWMRVRRGGTLDRERNVISGQEIWTRVEPTIDFVTPADGQPPIAELATGRSEPSGDGELHYLSTEETRREFGPDALGTYWLSVVGTNLPVAPARETKIKFLPQKMPVAGATKMTVEWTGRKRPNPSYPGVLDIQVVLREGLDAAPKRFRLDGAPGIWAVDLPDFEPVSIRYLRKANETDFETIDTIDIGDVFHVEAEYEEAPAAPRQVYLIKTGVGNGTQIHLERVRPAAGGDGRHIYRSARLLLLRPGQPDPADSDVRTLGDTGLASRQVDVIRANPRAKLETAEFDQPASVGPKPVAEATVREAPPSLWRGALNRARQCWDTGQSETEFTNFIVMDGVKVMSVPIVNIDIYNPVANPERRTLNVTLEEHAAALLVRDELRQTLGRYMRQITRANPVNYRGVPEEARRQLARWESAQAAETEALIRHAERGGDHPLLHMPVRRGRDSAIEVELRQTIVHDIVRYDDRPPENRRQWRQMAQLRIAEAAGKMSERGSRSLDHIRSVNPCDVKALLYLIRVGMKPVIDSLIPKLVRPRRGDEPAYPRHVPDRVARTYVAGIGILGSAIKAQDDYASADTDVLLAMGAVAGLYANAGMRTYHGARAVAGATGAGAEIASAAAAQMVQAGMTAMEIYDAYQVYKDMGDWRAAVRDEEFAWGASAVAGTERLTTAQQERRAAKLKAALGAGLSIAPSVAEGLAAGRIDLDVIPDPVRTLITQRAARNGIDSLSGPERLVFDRMAARARRSAADGRPREISPADRAALALEDAARARQSAAAAETPEAPPAARPTNDTPATREEPASAAPESPSDTVAGGVNGNPAPPVTRPRTDTAAESAPDTPTTSPDSPAAGPVRPDTVSPDLSVPPRTQPRPEAAETVVLPPPARTNPATADTVFVPPPRDGDATVRLDQPDFPENLADSGISNRPVDRHRPNDSGAATGSRTEPGDLRRARPTTAEPSRAAGNRPSYLPGRTERTRRMNELDRDWDSSRVPARVDPDPVGPGNYRFRPGDAERLDEFFRRTEEIAPDHVDDLIEYWRRLGVDPDTVMAGRAFHRNLDPSVTGQSPSELAANLDRYLGVADNIGDAAQRQRAIDRYFARGDDTAKFRTGADDRLPPSARPRRPVPPASQPPPPDARPQPVAADRIDPNATARLSPPDLPSDARYGHTLLDDETLRKYAREPVVRTPADPSRVSEFAPGFKPKVIDPSEPDFISVPDASAKLRDWRARPEAARLAFDAEVRQLIDEAAAIGDKWARRLQDAIQTGRTRYYYDPRIADKVDGYGDRATGTTPSNLIINPFRVDEAIGMRDLRNPEDVARTLIHEFAHVYVGPRKFAATRPGVPFTGAERKGLYNEVRAFIAEELFRRNMKRARDLNGRPYNAPDPGLAEQVISDFAARTLSDSAADASGFRAAMQRELRGDDFYRRYFSDRDSQAAAFAAWRGGGTEHIRREVNRISSEIDARTDLNAAEKEIARATAIERLFQAVGGGP